MAVSAQTLLAVKSSAAPWRTRSAPRFLVSPLFAVTRWLGTVRCANSNCPRVRPAGSKVAKRASSATSLSSSAFRCSVRASVCRSTRAFRARFAQPACAVSRRRRRESRASIRSIAEAACVRELVPASIIWPKRVCAAVSERRSSLNTDIQAPSPERPSYRAVARRSEFDSWRARPRPRSSDSD